MKIIFLLLITFLILIVSSDTLDSSSHKIDTLPTIPNNEKNNSTPLPSVPSVNNSTTNETKTPLPTPSIGHSSSHETPSPTTPYMDGKMKLIVDCYSVINYTNSHCGSEIEPCRTIPDSIKSFIDFNQNNKGIKITLLEIWLKKGFYNKFSYEEVAHSVNLYDLNVNVSIIGYGYGEVFIQGSQPPPPPGHSFDENSFIPENPFITIRSKENEPVYNRQFKFVNLTFELWTKKEIMVVDTRNEKFEPPKSTNNNNGQAITQTPSPTSNFVDGVVKIRFEDCQITQCLSEAQLFVSRGKNNTLDIEFVDVVMKGTNSFNIMFFKGSNVNFDGFQSDQIRATSSFVHVENSNFTIERSVFNSVTSYSGIFYFENSTVSINNSQFTNSFGNHAAALNYQSREPSFKVSNCVFSNNLVINNGENVGAAVIYTKIPRDDNKYDFYRNPQKRADNIKEFPTKIVLDNLVFQNNNSPKNKDAGTIFAYNVPMYINNCKFFGNSMYDHGPQIISRYSSIEIENGTIIDDKKPSIEQLWIPTMVGTYSSIKLVGTTMQPSNQTHILCERSIYELDHRTDVNVSNFVCNNIHDQKYNASYINIDSFKVNSFFCEILQVDGNGDRSVNLNEICTNNPRSKYHYEIKLTKVIIAIIVILCALLTIIPVFILANKIYKTLYKGYRPHDNPDIEEFNITPDGEYDDSDDSDDNQLKDLKQNNNNSNNNNNNQYQKSKLINPNQQNNDGFHEVLYDDEIQSNNANQRLIN